MHVDYPAAHSMDTCWFAVDAIGQVGMFDTGEEGHLPAGEDNDVRQALWELWKPESEERPDDWDTEGLCSQRGVYYFFYRDEYEAAAPVGFYVRSIAPKVPLHIDQLPPGLRDGCRQAVFAVRFDQVKQFQPLELTRCITWDPDSIAYLCGDGKTIKPIPGKDEQFAGFVSEFRKRHPRAAKRFIFAGPTE